MQTRFWIPFLFAVAMARMGWGATPEFQRQFRADDASAGDLFGRFVALDGHLGIIGAPGHDEAGEDSGVAYIFDVRSGQQLTRLVPNDGGASDSFGISVSIQGNHAIVGAIHDDDSGLSSGSAYLFDVTTGQQLHKLTAVDGGSGDEFGVAVDIDNGIAIVGAHMDGPGSAYLFDVSTGQQLTKLRSSDAAPEDLFGVAVALDGGRALVAARYDDDLGIASGSAYLFDVQSGAELHKLNAHDGAWGDRYGMYLDLNENRAVVGSRYDDDVTKSSGSAYVYDADSGDQLFKFVPGDSDPNDHFGSAISVKGGLALVSAVNDGDLGVHTGSVYLYDVNTGKELFKITADDAMIFDHFGESVAIDGDTILIGASMVDYPGAPGLTSGRAYVFQVPEPSAGLLSLLACIALLAKFRRRQ